MQNGKKRPNKNIDRKNWTNFCLTIVWISTGRNNDTAVFRTPPHNVPAHKKKLCYLLCPMATYFPFLMFPKPIKCVFEISLRLYIPNLYVHFYSNAWTADASPVFCFFYFFFLLRRVIMVARDVTNAIKQSCFHIFTCLASLMLAY